MRQCIITLRDRNTQSGAVMADSVKEHLVGEMGTTKIPEAQRGRETGVMPPLT